MTTIHLQRGHLTTIVIADDAVMVRERLRALIEELPGVEIVAETGDARSSAEVVRRLRPDVLVLDIQMPCGSGLDTLRQVKREPQSPTVIILTNCATSEHRTFCREAGADYFYDKSYEFEKVRDAICNVRAKQPVDPCSGRRDGFISVQRKEPALMKIVIVDDMEVMRTMIKGLMADLPGIEIIGELDDAPGAAAAIRTLRPDVVVLDIRLPNGSGIDVLRQIKQTQPAPAVIMMTALADRSLKAACLEAGADFFLDKSAELSRLPEVLQTLMERRNR